MFYYKIKLQKTCEKGIKALETEWVIPRHMKLFL